MLTADDLKQMADDELDALSLNVEKELTRRQRRRSREAVKQARALLAAAGFTFKIVPLEENLETTREMPTDQRKSENVPAGLYRNPRTGEEWRSGGRGRQPKWVREALNAGIDISGWKIEEETTEQIAEKEELS